MEGLNIWKRAGTLIKRDWLRYRGGILAAGALMAVLSVVGKGICPLANLWGLPCPGCGMSRSMLLLFTGHFSESLSMHPFAVLWLLFIAAVAAERYLMDQNGKWKRVVLVILLAGMFLLYLYKMLTVFPEAEPYVYLEGNLTEKLLPGYREAIEKLLRMKGTV